MSIRVVTSARKVTIQVPLRTGARDAAWLAVIIPQIADVLFGPEVTCVLTAPGRVP